MILRLLARRRTGRRTAIPAQTVETPRRSSVNLFKGHTTSLAQHPVRKRLLQAASPSRPRSAPSRRDGRRDSQPEDQRRPKEATTGWVQAGRESGATRFHVRTERGSRRGSSATRGPTRRTSCGGERRWPETAASRPGEAVWTERRERASAKADEPEPAVAGDRDESRGGEEPGTVQGRGCVQQALRDFKNERNGGWRRAASTACLERGWQESQRTRQRTTTTSRASPQGPAPLEGRSTRSQHGSSGRSRVSGTPRTVVFTSSQSYANTITA